MCLTRIHPHLSLSIPSGILPECLNAIGDILVFIFQFLQGFYIEEEIRELGEDSPEALSIPSGILLLSNNRLRPRLNSPFNSFRDSTSFFVLLFW